MPADAVPFVAIVSVAFVVFGLTLFWVSRSTSQYERAAARKR